MSSNILQSQTLQTTAEDKVWEKRDPSDLNASLQLCET